MHACTVTASTGATELTCLVVGHATAKVPRAVEAEAAAIAAGTRGSSSQLLVDGRRWLLIKPEPKPWLSGHEEWRLLAKTIIDELRGAKLASAEILVKAPAAPVQALVEGLILADYRYTACRSGEAAKRRSLTLRLPGQAAAVAAGIQVGTAQNIARELADAPGNVINPQTFVVEARKALRGLGVAITVVSGLAALRRAGFPGLVQVGKAGSAPPALLEIRYRPKAKAKGKAASKKAKGAHLALVGKGVTFDTGGISLKPGDKMWEMKGDMGGAAAVLAAIRLIAQTKPAIPVTAYIALAENMPDSLAQRPGDIYKTRTGLWVHVDNTDAEGRLILADVLAFAAERGATHMVDVATLTGACLVGLGDKVAGLMGRHDDWCETVRAVGLSRGEDFWRLPLHGEYRQLLDHPHADINNIGGRMGGTITAGIFLSEFVPETVRWAHCDIAGPAMQSGGWRCYAKGMTGFAARTLAALPSAIR